MGGRRLRTRLKEERHRRELSQAQVAQETGLSVSTISAVEHGDTPHSKRTINRLQLWLETEQSADIECSGPPSTKDAGHQRPFSPWSTFHREPEAATSEDDGVGGGGEEVGSGDGSLTEDVRDADERGDAGDDDLPDAGDAAGRSSEPAWGRSRKQVIEFIRHELRARLLQDRRIIRDYGGHTEFTLQAILFQHLSEFVGDSWLLQVEESVPSTTRKTDILMRKLRRDGEFNEATAPIAIEVKPDVQLDGLKRDVRKLLKYIRNVRSPVNAGVLVFFTRRWHRNAETLQSYVRRQGEHRLHAIHVNAGERPDR